MPVIPKRLQTMQRRTMKPRIVFALLLAPFALAAQNLLTNGGFESGDGKPDGWKLTGGNGRWISDARSGRHAIEVEGDGRNSFAWRTERMPLPPGGLHRLRFSARSTGSGGSIVSGTGRVNHDFHAGDQWSELGFTFITPSDASNDYVRLGQWEVNGRVSFEDAELLPVLATHGRAANGAELGEAESIRGGVYRFTPRFGWTGANYHRPLHASRASFNSDRWVFAPGSELIYRPGLRGAAQRGATLRVNVNYHTAGTLVVAASRDGNSWRPFGTFDATNRSGRLTLPAEFFPAEEIFIRLAAMGARVNFQVNTFDYEAPLAAPVADAEGRTDFLAVQKRQPDFAVRLLGARMTNGGHWAMDLAVSNRTAQTVQLRGSASTADGPALSQMSRPSSGHSEAIVTFAVPLTKAGAQMIRLQISDTNGTAVFAGETEADLPMLLDPRPGYWLAELESLGVWWCEPGWKIGHERAMPARTTTLPVRVSAARGEFEPAQVILRPRRDGELRAAKLTALRDVNGAETDITATIDEVAYVNIAHPTDKTCRTGLHPDPLPPLRTPLALRAGQNQPLWVTFRAGREARRGAFRGELLLDTTLGEVRVPVEVFVYDFALPKETHLASGFGLGTREINRYHRLVTQAEKEQVYAQYLQNFAEHRISPYSFFDYAPIDVRFTGTGAEKRAQVDFTKFDAAAGRWLDRAGFTAFRLPLKGMGGGTFHSRALGKLEGFDEGTPEHARLFADYLGQVQQHLQARGWLAKAYTYWFDEPDRKDYEFVVAGNKRIRAAAPGLSRLLTEQPEPELLGHVEIWCGLTPEWTPEKVRARRAAGERVWWYICTGPKAPYVTEFIDHPGTELRLWPWQSWQYGVDGILVWESTYWNSSAAFPAPQLQDPWSDPMSYVSGYDFKPGQIGHWGNGDGRFLYPPRRNPNTASTPDTNAPVNSVRWENLRDGMEDYEYFWLLQREVARLRNDPRASADVREAEALLTVPKEISADLTHFTTDPRLMMNHRDHMARMIERLSRK
jgi:hypothetical protein